jgi:hypothetical protein
MTPSAEGLRDFLAALVRAALMADADGARWVAEARRLREGVDPAALAHRDGAWAAAVARAESPEDRPLERRTSLTLPAACPLGAADLAPSGPPVEALVERLRGSAGTG